MEVELDAADQIRPFPGCKRVVSYTNLSDTPKDIDAIYQELQTKKPDIIKVTCKADSPEQAWPLVHLLNKPPVPTIVEARGPAGTLLTLVGRKVGAPWTTAAMERGMEAFAGQPTVRDLIDIYRYGDIGKKTRFVGVTGDGERSRLACGLLNAAFAHANLPHQALPMDMGSRRLFKKVADAIRLQSVLLDESQYEGLHEIAKLDETVVSPVLAGDGLTPGESEWTAFNALGPAVAAAVLDIYRERDGSANLKGRIIALAGCGVPTRMVAMPLKAAGASLLWASRDRNAVQAASQAFGGRQVIWEALYATSHDVLVIGRDGTKADNSSDKPLHPGYLKSGMVVVDLTAGLHPSKFLQEAEARSCRIVTPGRLLVEQVREHVRRLGAEVPAAVLMEKLAGWLPEE